MLFNDGTNAVLTPNEVQQIVLGANGGTFSLSTGTKIVDGLSASATLAQVTTAINTLYPSDNPRVACANGTGTCNGGPWQVIFDNSMKGKDVPLIAVDSSKLTDSNNLVQVLTLPAGTGNFWLAYPKSTGSLQLTDKLVASEINAADVKSALQTLNGLTAGAAGITSVTEIDGDSRAFVITLHDLSPAKTISVAGGFGLDFSANLGGLAGVKTTGDIIPLARLVASATFGINLSPTTSITESPGQFQAGPRVDVTTTTQGGKSVSLVAIRPGAAGVSAVWILTVKGGGTFDLGSVTGISASVSTGTLQGNVHTATGKTVDSVTENDQPGGSVYTITFNSSEGLVPLVAVNGANLTGGDEVQHVDVVNAHSGTFTLTFGGAVTDPLTYDVTTNPTTGAIKTALENLSSISGHGTVNVTGSVGHYTITFHGGLGGIDVGDISADASNLKGALNDGDLNEAASFDVAVTNQPVITSEISADGVTLTSVTTIADGGSGFSVNTTAAGSGHEVQDVTVGGAAGTFTLSFNGSAISSPLSTGASAATVQTALDTIGALAGNTKVIATATGSGGMVYRVIFTGLSTDQPQLTATASTGTTVGIATISNGGAASANEVQQVTIRGSSGTFKLGFGVDSTSDLTFTPPVTAGDLTTLASTVASAINGLSRLSTLGGTVTVTAANTVGGTVLTVTFGGSLAGADVPQLIARQPLATITQQGDATHNEIQTLTLTSSTPNVTLSFTNGGATSTTGSFAWNADGPTTIESALSALASVGGDNIGVAGSAGSYTFTFQGTLANHSEPTLLVSTILPRNENQMLTVLDAAGGSLTVGFDGNNSGTYTTGETASVAFDSTPATLASNIQAALEAITGIGTGNVSVTVGASAGQFNITFHGTMGGLNLKPVVITDATTLQAQNETQTIALVYATAGKFTLTLDGKTTTPLSFGASASDVATAISHLSTLPGGLTVSGTGTGTSGDPYVILFTGAGGGKHVNKLVGDPGALENSNVLTTISVTSFTASGTSAATLASALQNALDAAVVSNKELSPGFSSLSFTVNSAGVTATNAPYNGHNAPNDQAYEIDINLPFSTGTFTVNATGGNFKLTLTNGGPLSATTPLLAVGSGASLVQSAIGALFSPLGLGSATVNVTQSGQSYTVTLGGGASLSNLSAKIVLTGSAPVATQNAAGVASALQASLRATLGAAGITSFVPTVTLSGGMLHVASGGTGSFTLAFASPIVVQSGSASISLASPQANYTFDPNQAVALVNRHLDVSVDYSNSAFQQLGLATSPVKLTYAAGSLTGIDFTLFVNGAQVPVSISSGDLGSVTTINLLIAALQSAINGAIHLAFTGGAFGDTTGLFEDQFAITVCRPNINPAGAKCDDIGNRIEFDVLTNSADRTAAGLTHDNKISSLSMDVPAKLADGTANGAVTRARLPGPDRRVVPRPRRHVLPQGRQPDRRAPGRDPERQHHREHRLPRDHRNRGGPAGPGPSAARPDREHRAEEPARQLERPADQHPRHQRPRRRDHGRPLPLRLG